MTDQVLTIDSLSVVGRNPRGAWVPIVRGVSMSISAGEVVALIGESGAGKTTVALASLSYFRPGTRLASGKILFGGIDMLALGASERRRVRGKTVAYVAQSAQAALNPAITIGDQIVEPLLLHGLLPAKEARKRAIALLDLLDLPNSEQLSKRYPHQISGGQQQRVMLAMALTCDPRLLVLDEPTTALDVTTQIEVLKAIKAVIRQHETAAIYVSHDLAVVTQVADRIVVMKDGAIIEEGRTSDIIERPRQAYTRQLLSAARRSQKGGLSAQEESATPLIQVMDVSATYKRSSFWGSANSDADVLHAVGLDVRQQEVVALVGESGSGKSTVARVIAGLHPPRQGQLRFRGRILAPQARERDLEALRRIQIIFQSPDLSLNPENSVGEAIGRPLDLYFGLPHAERASRVAELLITVGLSPDYARRFPAELSGGQRQRVSIARAFAAKPDIVLCDEILSSLDSIVAAQVLELMRDLREQSRVAYLFISHDLATVSSIADRVVVLYSGRVVETGPTASVFKSPRHPYTALLLSSMPSLRQGWLEEVLETRFFASPQAVARPPVDLGCSFRTRCPLAIVGTCDKLPAPRRSTANGKDIYCHREIDELIAMQV